MNEVIRLATNLTVILLKWNLLMVDTVRELLNPIPKQVKSQGV